MRYTHWLKNSLIKLLFSLPILTLTLSTTAFATPVESASGEQEQSPQIEVLVNRSLPVSRYRSASINNSEADRIFNSGTQVLQRNDGSGDVACDITLRRGGNVGTFNTGDGSIDSSSELNAVLGTAGFVKVVNRINWCGGFSPNIIGCAPVPGNSMVVIRFNSSLEGILWAHEYGHTRGLRHRSSSTAIMNGTIGNNRRRVTSSECSSFRR